MRADHPMRPAADALTYAAAGGTGPMPASLAALPAGRRRELLKLAGTARADIAAKERGRRS